MSLVAYDSSDESGEESDQETVNQVNDSKTECDGNVIKDYVPPSSSEKLNHHSSDDADEINELKPHKFVSNLFSSLPAPKSNKTKFELEEETKTKSVNEALPRKQPVKITVPSLSDFKDDESEEPIKKKLKPSTKGSGLFSILPAPKHLTLKETKRPLVPHVLTKKPAPPLKPVKKEPKKEVNNESNELLNYEESGDDSDGEAHASSNEKDFFSLSSDPVQEVVLDNNITPQTVETGQENVSLNHSTSSSVEPIENVESDEIPTQIPIPTEEDKPLAFKPEYQSCIWPNYSLPPPPPPPPPPDETPSQPHTSASSSYFLPIVKEELQLDDEALQKLCGRRAKRNGQPMELIDVSGDAIMPNPKEWLLKQFTEEKNTKSRSHSHRRHDGPTTQQRRKHQITYLAFQAKENELELKNQWSQNRMSRKQTQSKYGF